MSRLLLSLLAVLSLPNSAAAQGADCLEQVRQIYVSSLNPLLYPPHRVEMHVFSPDGTSLRIEDSLWESPFSALSGIRGQSNYALLIGPDLWTGPSPEGPWTRSDFPMPADRRSQIERNTREQSENLHDLVCPALVALEGRQFLSFSFSTQTNKDANGAFFGTRNTVYLDPDSKLPIRWDMTDFISSWKPGVDHELQVSLFSYDPTIKLPRPE